MRKIILLLICILVLAGCNQNELELYKKAVEKTDTIDYAKSKTEINMDVEFGESIPEGLEDIKDLLEEINYSNNVSFSKSENKRISRQYIGNEQMGVDTVYYFNDGNSFLKIPFIGKFIKLDEESFGDMNFSEPPITEDSLLKIIDKWHDLVNEEDVINLGNEVVDTPEGEVKVKKLVVTFTDVQLKLFMDDLLKIIGEDERLKSEINNYVIYNVDNDELTETDIEVDLLEFIKKIREFMTFLSFDSFTVTSYIDIDDYIVNEEFDINISFISVASNYIKSISFTSIYQLYDIGEKIEFIYPELNENNTTTIELLLEELDIQNYIGGF